MGGVLTPKTSLPHPRLCHCLTETLLEEVGAPKEITELLRILI